MTKQESKEFEAYKQAEQQGYIKRCEKCGSLKILVYTDEDYFSDMIRCICGNCKHKFAYSDN